MSFSDIFHPESDPVEPHDAPNHVVFSCLQWKTPNLEMMPRAAKQSFAVMYGDTINQFVTAALERAYILSAMSAVKLIAVHEDHLHLFLDSEVSSTTFREIEALWAKVTGMGRIMLAVDFSTVNEIFSEGSGYVFWPVVKEILESHALGIEQYDLLALDNCSEEVFIDDHQWFYLSNVDSHQPEAAQKCPIPIEIPTVVSMFKQSEYLTTT